MTKKKISPEYVQTVLQRLQTAHPDAHCELNYETPLQLLVATILSAQCTDVRVNKVTPALFAKYPDVTAFAAADRAELEDAIHSTGFFRQKASFIQETAVSLLQNHGGQVPDEMAQLIKLKGVARKTANVVLGEIYGKSEGITVDTHVKRIAKKLGLTSSDKNPVKVERELMAIIPKEQWINISHLLIFHGRRVCIARRPDCPNCTLNDICPSVEL
ncbi:Endonuclease III [hydrothermal vent metagenome]|uniref:Endonuclease III n=1 Tax=hydrothermal vent metagenome TaxID=652676 RepID=A0A3B0UZI5_9ZZZZ